MKVNIIDAGMLSTILLSSLIASTLALPPWLQPESRELGLNAPRQYAAYNTPQAEHYSYGGNGPAPTVVISSSSNTVPNTAPSSADPASSSDQVSISSSPGTPTSSLDGGSTSSLPTVTLPGYGPPSSSDIGQQSSTANTHTNVEVSSSSDEATSSADGLFTSETSSLSSQTLHLSGSTLTLDPSSSLLITKGPGSATPSAMASVTTRHSDSCNHNNCLRQLIAFSSVAAGFCAIYTVAQNTATTGLPTFVSQCSGLPSKISSACSCIQTGPVATAFPSFNGSVSSTSRTSTSQVSVHPAESSTSFMSSSAGESMISPSTSGSSFQSASVPSPTTSSQALSHTCSTLYPLANSSTSSLQQQPSSQVSGLSTADSASTSSSQTLPSVLVFSSSDVSATGSGGLTTTFTTTLSVPIPTASNTTVLISSQTTSIQLSTGVMTGPSISSSAPFPTGSNSTALVGPTGSGGISLSAGASSAIQSTQASSVPYLTSSNSTSFFISTSTDPLPSATSLVSGGITSSSVLDPVFSNSTTFVGPTVTRSISLSTGVTGISSLSPSVPNPTFSNSTSSSEGGQTSVISGSFSASNSEATSSTSLTGSASQVSSTSCTLGHLTTPVTTASSLSRAPSEDLKTRSFTTSAGGLDTSSVSTSHLTSTDASMTSHLSTFITSTSTLPGYFVQPPASSPSDPGSGYYAPPHREGHALRKGERAGHGWWRWFW